MKRICIGCDIDLERDSHRANCPEFYSGPPMRLFAVVEVHKGERGAYFAYPLYGSGFYGDSPREAWLAMEKAENKLFCPADKASKQLLMEPEIVVCLSFAPSGRRQGEITIEACGEDFDTRVSWGVSVTLPAEILALSWDVLLKTVATLIGKVAVAYIEAKREDR